MNKYNWKSRKENHCICKYVDFTVAKSPNLSVSVFIPNNNNDDALLTLIESNCFLNEEGLSVIIDILSDAKNIMQENRKG